MTYASIEDLQAGWRTLDDDEVVRAQTLLERASYYLDEVIDKYHIDVDAKREALKIVCCDLVSRKMQRGVSSPVSSVTEQAGAFSETISFGYSRRQSWELYPEDKELLGVRSHGARMLKIAIHNKGGEEIAW